MTLTNTEFRCLYGKLLEKFSCAGYNQCIADLWQSNKVKINSKDLDLLWLFVYALDFYEHFDTAVNYITEQQAMAMFAKANAIT